ncbi:MAG: hypothetical protein FWG56_05910 [Desulfovibrionaceae bacterium]|nr:hypothetical protein [Desulfovibrionaceae bacterium]
MRIAPHGQRSAHCAQPVQPGASCSAAVLRQPSVCSDSARGKQAATHQPHQPQPVQRAASICGAGLAPRSV